MKFFLSSLLLMLLVLFGCETESTMFRLVDPGYSGVTFSNMLVESDTFNALKFEYIYNGAGVGVADFNNDGLPDIFFAGNMTSSKLYINRGNLKFEDVTLASGLETKAWCVGVSVVDINRDGRLDIHVSTIHPNQEKLEPNLFFINTSIDEQGVPKFENLAAELGLADSSYSTQSVFLDYDLDGDLDMYLLTNAIEKFPRNNPVGQRYDGKGKSVDRLYRQDTLPNGSIHFSDVSTPAGILGEGWGLGIVSNDFNDDGWPDIYCANDFLSSDHLYINQRDGTFKDEIANWMNHQEFNGMGADIADLNNDGLNDLVVVDMMPDDNLRQKTMFSNITYDRFMNSLRMKYQPQYVRNVLQRNNGNNTFSDIGYLSGIYATDWSWSPLLADFDNDGLRDIFISNGYPKDITDLDFVMYNNDASMFGTNELKEQKVSKAIRDLEGVFKPNFLFHNQGDFQFENAASNWGLSEKAYSTGTAYADLDNDGDLDLILNNLNGAAHLYENTINQKSQQGSGFLRIEFNGTAGNPQGIGAKVWVYVKDKVFYAEQQLQRGYLSSVDPVMHFGLGPVSLVDSIIILWPGKHMQVMPAVSANSVITADYSEAKLEYKYPPKKATLLVQDESMPLVVQLEQEYVDFKNGQSTLPHKFSQQGPGLAVGDINGDGLDDFIVGGPAHQSAKIVFQELDGRYRVDSLDAKESEDVGLCLFDADQDGDLDLYCVSGGSEFGQKAMYYQDRLYLNNGKGRFSLGYTALPKIESSGSCVIAEDFDNDGDMDLFVGGRVVPMSYPLTPRSYLLLNDGHGKFDDVTSMVSDGLDSAGMVTCALFDDFDKDGWKDLMVAGEWMPLTMYRNDRGYFRKAMESKTGWWSSLAKGDFDNDGDIDCIAGNLGRNSVLQTSTNEPVSIYAKDFDGNGSIDPIISRYINRREYPVHYRETITEQVVSLKKLLRSYADYGKKEMPEILDFLNGKDTFVRRADSFESSYLENLGDGNFLLHPLPLIVQVSPINSISVCDLNEDGNLDFLAVGNSFAEETLSGYYDAGIGICAMGKGDGTFEFLPPSKSGFCVRSDTKEIGEVVVGNQRKWIVTSNQAPLVLFNEVKPFFSNP